MGLVKNVTLKKPWTKKQDQTLLRLKKEGKTVAQIAKKVGHSEPSVLYRFNRPLKHGRIKNLDKLNYRPVKRGKKK